MVVLCFDGRLAGETPTAEKPVPPAAGGGEAWLDSILSAAWRGQPCVDPDDPSTSLDCFQLWNACRPLYLLVVEGPTEDAEEIGLTKERIQTAAESRLRAARLYDAEAADHFLYVNVNVVGRAYSIGVGYRKWLHDEALDIGGMAETWNTGSAGTHGGGARFILQDVSEHMDRFVVEYLRVNEPACGGP